MRRLIVVLVLLLALVAPSVAQAHHHPQVWAWYRQSGARCVHSYEGSWTADTGNGYYGGFQMDWSFMAFWNPRRLAAHGTANHWTAEHQVATVRRAVKRLGWSPWPNTARYCGLL